MLNKISALLLVLSCLTSGQTMIYKYFPALKDTNTVWLVEIAPETYKSFKRAKHFLAGVYLEPIQERRPAWRFSIVDSSRLTVEELSLGGGEHRVIADVELDRYKCQRYFNGQIDNRVGDVICCVADDTTITTILGTFEHCRIYYLDGDPKCPITSTDTLIIAPRIGFIQNVVYAQVAGKVWGKLPNGLTYDDIMRPKYRNPDDPPTSVVVKERFPGTFTLHQNYPNPFNGTTTISFELDKPGEIELSIFDIKGHKVTTLFSGFKDTGVYQVNWDAANVPSGVYFVRLSKGLEHTFRKMVYTR